MLHGGTLDHALQDLLAVPLQAILRLYLSVFRKHNPTSTRVFLFWPHLSRESIHLAGGLKRCLAFWQNPWTLEAPMAIMSQLTVLRFLITTYTSVCADSVAVWKVV